MNMLYAIVISALIVGFVSGIGVLREVKELAKEWREPPVIPSRMQFMDVYERWIEQPLDHFNKRDNRTWKMRYLENDAYYNRSGPIFIMLGGEWTINDSFLKTGFMHDLARDVGAAMYYTEHRFYGKSQPRKNLSTENLQYLNVDQALADVAYFIDLRRKEAMYERYNASVIVFGGSYAANMATWMRLKYPHLVQGALASSGPVYAKTDFYEYLDVVRESLRTYKEQCVTDLKTAVDEVSKLIETNKTQDLQEQFKLCSSLNTSSPNDVSSFGSIFSGIFSSVVQYNKPIDLNSSVIATVCDVMTDENLGPPIDRLAKIVQKFSQGCNDVEYDVFVTEMRITDTSVHAGGGRQWLYQTCTEYGYYQTTNSKDSIFGKFVGLDFYINMCKDVYGEYYNDYLLQQSVRRTNIVYGGRTPDLSNVIFVNGKIDPWHALSVLQNLNDNTPSFLINETSHCVDLKPDNIRDSKGLKETRKRNRNIIKSWLQKHSST